MTERYRLFIFPMVDPQPFYIEDAIGQRPIASFRNTEATMDEAKIMTAALNAAVADPRRPGYRNAGEDEPERTGGWKP